ncbi:MAG: FMN-binding negative transcriptional regulator [Balneola sp.]
MYSFPYFTEKDQKIILDFISENPFAFLTGSTLSGEQVATQIPILFIKKGNDLVLQGHIMRNTDHHKALSENPEALIVFSGPHCYVSASWYSNPKIGSTWNYMSVHMNGEIKFMNDGDLIQFMKKLTLKFEEGNSKSPTFYDNLPDEFLNKMMPAIVGFELKVKSIKNTFKLSQNRDKDSYLNIISHLKNQDYNSIMIAEEMEKRLNELFPPDSVWDEKRFSS